MKRNEFRWRLLKQALLQKKAKALLILLAVAMGASVVTALLNLQMDLRYRMNRELRDYGPNVVLIPHPDRKDPFLHQALLSSLDSISKWTQVLAYTPEIFVPVNVNGQPVVIVGANQTALRKLYPNWKLQIWGSGSEMDNGVVVGVRLAKKLRLPEGKFSQIRIGIPGVESKYTVVGFLESGESEDDQVLVDLPLAQKISKQEGRFHIIVLSVLGDLDSVQRAFSAFARSNPEVSYQIIRKIAAAETLILEKISRLMAMVISLILVILFFCIHTTVSAILLSRQGEIALFRVLGARRKQIMLELLLELLVLGLVGGLLGYSIGIFMAQVLGKVLFQTFIVPHFGIFVITIVSSLVLMVVSSVLPIRRAINRQAALVLKEA